ncbi:MAG TPA: NAD(P)/FAD-dependent oxidoreductase [Thermomicrobiales bacterium]|nr:NAD(P)/FAD-dependent oxidoreductase [Thermomicrobiales bacterium]
MSSSPQRIGVIGGGFAGLTAALRLAQAGHDVTLWEKGRFGGQAATIPIGDTRIEIFYHHLFQSDTSITALANELGVGDRLMWLPSNVGYYADGRILPLNGAVDLLKLSILPIWDRLRVGLVTAYLQRVKDWKRFEDVTAHEWLTKALGKNAYDKTLGAQLRAKFGRYYDKVAMVWFWGKIWLRTTSRRSPLDQEKLGYFDGSFQVMVDAMVRGCEQAGVHMVKAGISTIHQLDDGRWSVATEHDDAPGEFDKILATTPSNIFQRLVPDLPAAYSAKLNALEYEAAVVALLELEHPLSEVYWLNIADSDLPFTAVIEHTNFVDPAKYGGKRLVYLSKYIEPDHPYFTMSEDEIIEAYIPHLKKINPDFNRSWITGAKVFRERAAQPIIPLHYSSMIPEHRTPLRNLYLANTTQIYPEDRGTNYSVRLGEQIAAMMLADMKAQ